MSVNTTSALETAAIEALRRLHKIPDGTEAVFDIVAILGMIEMFMAMIEQCQASQGRLRRRRRRTAAEMLAIAQDPPRRVYVGAWKTARRDGNSKEESVELVDVWIETAKNTTVQALELMIDEVENPMAA